MGSWSSKASLSLVRLNYIKIAHPHTCKHRHTVPSCIKEKKTQASTQIFCEHLSGFQPQIIHHTPTAGLPKKNCFYSVPNHCLHDCSQMFFSDVLFKEAHDLCVGHLHLLAVPQYLPAKRSPSLWQNGKRYHTLITNGELTFNCGGFAAYFLLQSDAVKRKWIFIQTGL